MVTHTQTICWQQHSHTYVHPEIALQILSLMRECFIIVQSYSGEIFSWTPSGSLEGPMK